MKIFQITILNRAIRDLDELAIYISEIHKAPLTAKKYTTGIINEVRSLRNRAESIPITTNKHLLIYGKTSRRVNFKKHAIIFTVQNNTVIIRRIMPSALIK